MGPTPETLGQVEGRTAAPPSPGSDPEERGWRPTSAFDGKPAHDSRTPVLLDRLGPTTPPRPRPRGSLPAPADLSGRMARQRPPNLIRDNPVEPRMETNRHEWESRAMSSRVGGGPSNQRIPARAGSARAPRSSGHWCGIRVHSWFASGLFRLGSTGNPPASPPAQRHARVSPKAPTAKVSPLVARIVRKSHHQGRRNRAKLSLK